VSRPLHIQINELAKAQVRAAEEWWRFNRPKAPNAIREEFERAASLIALQPEVGTRARNVTLPGVRRLRLDRGRYYIYYHGPNALFCARARVATNSPRRSGGGKMGNSPDVTAHVAGAPFILHNALLNVVPSGLGNSH
jgi:hypothetical protein